MTIEEKTILKTQATELEKLKRSYLLLLNQVDELLNAVEKHYGKLQRKVRREK